MLPKLEDAVLLSVVWAEADPGLDRDDASSARVRKKTVWETKIRADRDVGTSVVEGHLLVENVGPVHESAVKHIASEVRGSAVIE